MNNNEKVFPYKTTIEIDCDPWTGMGRQQTHYEHICKNIVGCEPQPRISASFGCWEWPITYQTKEQQDKTAEFLKDLYNRFDIDGDGEIDISEFIEGFKKL